jgi:amino acid adenylation domain-containing protein
MPELGESIQQNINARIKEIFSQLLGTDVEHIDDDSTFLSIGADSLLLLQASQRIQGAFKIKVPFRALLEEYATFAQLTRFLEQKLPAQVIGSVVDSKQTNSDARGPVADRGAADAGALIPEDYQLVPLSEVPNGKASGKTPVGEGTRTAPGVEQIVKQQLHIMSQQLEMLRSLGISPSENPPVATIAETVVVPPVTVQMSTNGAASHATNASQNGKKIKNPPIPPAPVDKRVGEGRLDEAFVPYQPRRVARLDGLTELQKRHIESLIARYAKRTQKSKQHAQESRRNHADNRGTAGFNLTFKEVVYPLVIKHAQGAHIWDADNNEYVDIAMGFGGLLFGHSPSFLIEALEQQLKHGIGLGLQSEMVGKAARLLCELTGMERASFCNSGTEAVMTALRLARAVTGRSKIVVFAGAFHGTFDGVLVRGQEHSPQDLLKPTPLAPGVTEHLIGDVILSRFGDVEALAMIKAQAHELAAVLVELPQSRRPDFVPLDFIRELRKITADTGVALVFDEVVSGFRAHPGGAQALFGIQADLAAYGKAMGGGLPVAAIAGKAEYMDAVDGGVWNYGDDSYPAAIQTFFAGTYFKHPLLMPAVYAVLDHLKKSGPQLQKHLNQRTETFTDKLDRFFMEERAPVRMVHFGSLFRFSFLPRYKAVDANVFYYHLLENGVNLPETRNGFLSTAHTDEDVEHILWAVKDAYQQARAGGFLGGSLDPPDPPRPPDATEKSGEKDRVGEQEGHEISAATPIDSAARGKTQPGASLEAEKQEETAFPLAEEQKELWFMSIAEIEASRAYNQSLSLHLRGPLRIEALRQALRELVLRHETLRTTIDRTGSEQHISSGFPIYIAAELMGESDFSRFTEAERKRQLEHVQRREARQLFDLEKGPLWHAHLITREKNDHVLLFTIHHIIADGRSLGILLHELGILYDAASVGKLHSLPAPFPYRRYLQHQRELEQSEEMEAAERYWLTRFADTPPMLEFPTDHPRPPVKTFHGAKHHFEIAGDLYRALTKRGLQDNCTLYTTLLAAYSAFLVRITGQRDLVVPISSAGQLLIEGGDELVGHCVKLLPIRISIDGNPLLRDYLKGVKRALVAAQEHQIYPFTRLVQKLKLPRDPSRVPLAATDFNLDVGGELRFPGLDVAAYNNVTDFAQFDFSINIMQTQEKLLIEYSYNTDLFVRETIERWEGYFRTLLRQMGQETTQHFADLTLLDRDDMQRFVAGQPAQRPLSSPGRSFIQLFEEQAARTPDAIAVGCEEEQWTYRALDEQADRMAWLLRDCGVSSETLVVLLADRRPVFLCAILAVFKAGGAYLPLNPHWPEKQYARVLESSLARIVLTSDQFQPKLRAALETLEEKERPRIYLLEELTRAEQVSRESALPDGEPSNLAYVIYTSGSTGSPKGAMVEQRGMLNHLCAKVEELSLTGQDAVAQNASQSFDISVWQFLAALLMGGRVQIICDPDINDPEMLLEQARRHNVSVLEVVPSLLQGLFLLLEAIGAEIPTLPYLRWLISTGEALLPGLARQWLNAYPNIPILNGYGPTECSDDVTHHVISTPPGEMAMLVPIGHPLANLALYVLDSDLQPIPPGVPGELYVGGIGVGRGYLRDPSATAAAFVPHPFPSEPGSRLYKTGDRVRLNQDGDFEFFGRIDHQVKVRGFRIELGEIEGNLRRHSAVRDAVVIVREDQPGEKRLVGYIIAARVLTSQQLRAWIREQVPEYMVPAAFVFLERFPLTSNGKIDVRGLPAPEQDQTVEQISRDVPRDSIESLLTEIWQSVLHREGIGIHDNFFEVGGDSILSIKIIVRLSEAGFKLTTREIFQYQTIAELATVIEQPSDSQVGQGAIIEVTGTEDFQDSASIDLDAEMLSDLLSKVRFDNGRP